ncbi:MAG TPA: ABC transporter substrate-binding protein [Nakamurella sp.]|jgi:NitT/TauT family transport system substrate-binding protein|nr:ABC transporter substrate-binding protein [Nakamurella sp.]
MPANDKHPLVITRRRLFTGGTALAAGALLGAPLLAACGADDNQAGGSSAAGGSSPAGGATSGSAPGGSGSTSKVDFQIAWVGDNGVLGEVVAFQKGFYKDAGLDLTFRPGGPSIDPVTTTASGAVTFAQTSSSPAIMLGRSQGLPIKAFAAQLQSWPWALISTAKNPVLKPQDLIGKTVGTQSTGQILIKALLAQNKIDPDQVKVQVVGSDVTPLVTGRIDVYTGWTTNLQSYEPLGDDYHAMTLGDAGIPSYAGVYLATDEVLEKRADELQAFLVASGKGWDYARQNPDESVDLLVKQFSGLDKAPQLAASKKLMSYMFDDATAQDGWATMSKENWQSQLDLWDSLGQFEGKTPKVDDVMTLDILEATKSDRPKVGKA